ncbi:DNA helicase, partial [Candidatus Neomarinimicrobiota bacterium]
SVDRIHRLGLGPEDDTFIEVLMGRNTLDAVVQDRLNQKIERMGKVLNDRNLLTLAYYPEDIEAFEEYDLDNQDIDAVQQHVNI